MKAQKIMTILDRELERVFQYKISTNDYISFLQDKGHRLKYCEFMVHDNPNIFQVKIIDVNEVKH